MSCNATRDGRIEKHPDQRVQDAIELAFAKFAELGSGRQSLLWFRQERLTLPSVERDPAWGAEVGWRLPVYNTLLKFLTNPFYAGAYAFGRTGTRTTVVDGAPRTTRGHRRAREEWIALIQDHREPYISGSYSNSVTGRSGVETRAHRTPRVPCSCPGSA
jgi:recombinase